MRGMGPRARWRATVVLLSRIHWLSRPLPLDRHELSRLLLQRMPIADVAYFRASLTVDGYSRSRRRGRSAKASRSCSNAGLRIQCRSRSSLAFGTKDRGRIKISRRKLIADRFQVAARNDSDALPSEIDVYLISSARRLSTAAESGPDQSFNHSYDIGIDIAAKRSYCWRWMKEDRRRASHYQSET